MSKWQILALGVLVCAILATRWGSQPVWQLSCTSTGGVLQAAAINQVTGEVFLLIHESAIAQLESGELDSGLSFSFVKVSSPDMLWKPPEPEDE